MSQDPSPWSVPSPGPPPLPTGPPPLPTGPPQPPGHPPAGYPEPPGYPPAGYPQPPGYPPAGYPQPGGTDGFAITSLVFGLIGFVGSIPALIFGIISLRRIARSGGLTSGRGLAITGIVLAGVWLLLGIVGLAFAIAFSHSPNRTPTVTRTAGQAGTVRLADLRVGDCLRDEPDPNQGVDVAVVACTAAHHAEVFSNGQAAGGTSYPGDATMQTQAEDMCTAASETNLGPDITDAESFNVYPTQDSWAAGDRTITCLISTAAATTTDVVVAGSR